MDEGSVLTSAGVDCRLHVARRFFGPQRASDIARNIVALPHRAGGQTQFIQRPLAESSQNIRLRESVENIVRQLAHTHSIESVAARAGMSRRSFTRLFQQTMGVSFSSWLNDQRLILAQQYLEASDRSVEQVAFDAGFGSAVTFRTRFQERFGVSPTEWRRSFQGAGDRTGNAPPQSGA